jgi:hypothetical protein
MNATASIVVSVLIASAAAVGITVGSCRRVGFWQLTTSLSDY